MRDFLPSNFFRAELLKAIKFPEISYRKFCTDNYFGHDQKQNRVFMRLSLRKNMIIDHTQLSQFCNSLTFTQQVNLLVYILGYQLKAGQPAKPGNCTDLRKQFIAGLLPNSETSDPELLSRLKLVAIYCTTFQHL